MKKTTYKAVDCGFHDQIEAAIVLRTLGSISFLNAEGKEEQREAIKILDWVNKKLGRVCDFIGWYRHSNG